MKKHNIIALIGVLALTANLLIPGLAFGQTQTGTLDVECTIAGAATLPAVPSAVTFDSVTPDGSVQSSYDSLTNDSTALPAANRIQVTDTKSGGVDGCTAPATGYSGFALTAQILTPCDGTTGLCSGTNVIEASQIYIVTSRDNFNIVGITPAPTADGDVMVSPITSSGNDIAGASIDGDLPYDGNAFNTDLSYINNGGPLNASQLLMSTPDSWNANIYQGVAIAIVQGIDAYQPYGTYVGTITYTLQDKTYI